jgi:hypothetical protein
MLPDSGWVTASIQGPGAVAGAIDLFRLSYERGATFPAFSTGLDG